MNTEKVINSLKEQIQVLKNDITSYEVIITEYAAEYAESEYATGSIYLSEKAMESIADAIKSLEQLKEIAE